MKTLREIGEHLLSLDSASPEGHAIIAGADAIHRGHNIEGEAYWLLAWTHQHLLEGDPRDVPKGLVSLDAGRDHLNAGEQRLLDVLLPTSNCETSKGGQSNE